MLFYLIIGFFTALSFYIADKKSSFIFIRIIFLAMFFLLPSIIEGCRNENIGTDMLVYGQVYFYDCKNYNSFIKYLYDLESKEYAYHILNYFSSKIGGINVFLFITASIKMLIIGNVAWFFRKKLNTFLLIFLYMMFFYWYEFSLMRQGLAIAFSLLSLKYFYNHRYIKFYICICLSYLFHNSGVFMLFLPVLDYISKFRYRTFISSFGIILMYFISTTLYVFLSTTGLFGESKYELYLDSGVASAKTNILIVCFFLIITFIYKIRDDLLTYYVRCSCILGLAFLLLSSSFEVAFRVSFYQMCFLLLGILMFVYQCRSYKVRFLLNICIMILFILHIVIASNHGMADTIPYKSSILGISFS